MIFEQGHVSRKPFIKNGFKFFQILTVMQHSVELEILSYHGDLIESIEVSSVDELNFVEECISQTIFDWIEKHATEVDRIFAKLNGWREC